MATAEHREHGYHIEVVDGYVSPTTSPRLRRAMQELTGSRQGRAPYELLLACFLHMMNTPIRGELRDDVLLPCRDPLSFWVLGAEGWIDSPPEILQPVMRGERNSEYRIVLSARDSQTVRNPASRWNGNFLKVGGMRRRKLYTPRTDFKALIRPLTARLHEYCAKHDELPGAVFEKLGIPFEFYTGPSRFQKN